MADNKHDIDFDSNDECCRLEERLVEETHKVRILLQALECIIESKDPNDPIKIAKETLEAYAARMEGK